MRQRAQRQRGHEAQAAALSTVDVCVWFWYSRTRKASQDPHMPSTFGRFLALHTVTSSFVRPILPVCVLAVSGKRFGHKTRFLLQPIPADMSRISIGKPNFVLPNIDSVNHCTSKYLFISILISLLVQWLTESRFGKTKFGFSIEIRRYRTRLGDLKNKQSTERESHVCGDRL